MTQQPHTPPQQLTVAGFFSGTGGIELGLVQTGHFAVAYANEIDPYPAETYRLNFGTDHHQTENVINIDYSRLPDINIVTGGFPCQAFSQAGYRQGFNDEQGRGNLFFNLAKVIETKQPEIILLENVKGLIGHDSGNTLQVILETLTSLGYHTSWKVLNAKDYGNIPQGRERIYIVGFRDEATADQFTWPEPTPLTATLQDCINYDTKVDDRYYYTADKNPTIYPELQAAVNREDRIYQWRRKYVRENKTGVAPTLTANMGTGGHNVPIIYTRHGIRKLTPRECFNLMGYPQTYQLPNQSDSRLYKQAGNAVVVPVIRRIGEQIIKAYQHSQ